ncbi:MAG: hypothetical protein XXXNARYT_003134 [Candidatus Accumulibacter regalis]
MRRARTRFLRFIPAPAGNAPLKSREKYPPAVHPRACGERVSGAEVAHKSAGSSPRLRGTRCRQGDAEPVLRFIPAPAGNAVSPSCGRIISAVHPRACGERCWKMRVVSPVGGSSPRLRGTLKGSSDHRRRSRFIPAPAGNALRVFSPYGEVTVHPRACGERKSSARRARALTGSSPRLRGTRLPVICRHRFTRFIPAPAGNAQTHPAQPRTRAVHPRACGERSLSTAVLIRDSGSSPRLRGTLGRGCAWCC